MWIPVRSSDISKKAERKTSAPCLFAILFLLAGAGVLGCVVTDKIKFEEAVNYPISILRNQPAEATIAAPANSEDELTFSAMVWDEDVTDVDGDSIWGRLEVRLNSWSKALDSGNCKAPLFVDSTDTEKSDLPIFLIECTVEASVFNTAEAGLLEIHLTVSDLGFIGERPRPNSQTAEVLWVMQL